MRATDREANATVDHSDNVRSAAPKESRFVSRSGELTVPKCGKYELGLAAAVRVDELTDDLRNALSCATRQASEAGDVLPITDTNVSEMAASHTNTRVADNQQRLLEAIARRQKKPNLPARVISAEDFTLIDCAGPMEFEWHLKWLTVQNLADITATATNLFIMKP